MHAPGVRNVYRIAGLRQGKCLPALTHDVSQSRRAVPVERKPAQRNCQSATAPHGKLGSMLTMAVPGMRCGFRLACAATVKCDDRCTIGVR